MSQKISAITKLTPKAGKFAELCACAEQMAGATKDEAGTEVYFVSRSNREPEILFVFELFTDKDAFKAHAAAGGAVGELLAPLVESAEVVLGTPLAGEGLTV